MSETNGEARPRPRYILAALFGHPDVEAEYSHAIIEVTRVDLQVVQRATKFARQFDLDFDEGFTKSSLTSGAMHGEYVLKYLPDDLGEWLEGQEDICGELPRLLPRELDLMVGRIIEEDWRSNDNRWASNTVKWKCDAESVHGEIDDKYASDLYVWTRDLRAIFDAPDKDFETPGFAVPA